MSNYVKSLKLDDLSSIGMIGTPRLMQKKDYAAVFALYKQHMEKYAINF